MTGRSRVAVLGAGLALLAGGTLGAAVHHDSFSDTAGTWTYQVGAWATLVGCVALVVWVLRQERPYSGAPAVAAATGSCLMAALAFTEAAVNPAIADAAPRLLDEAPSGTMLVGMSLCTLAFAVGWVVQGAALLRHGHRRAPALALVVAGVVSAVPFAPGPALVGLVLVWLGTSAEVVPQPADRPLTATTSG
jgi:hypothetical protein